MNSHPIQVRHLRRSFGPHLAVNDISFVVPKGRILALLGRNGAGKTTTMRMLAGLLAPSAGDIALLGTPLQDLRKEHRERIGYMAEGSALFKSMRVQELVSFQRRFYPRFDDALCTKIINAFRLKQDQYVGELSHGQRAGLHLAVTLAPEPEVLLLDDPLMGLDPVARRQMLEAIVDFAHSSECAVVFSSHLLDDVERTADAIAVLDSGTLRVCCSLHGFQERVLQFHLEDAPADEVLLAIPGHLKTRTLRDGVKRVVLQGGEAELHHRLEGTGAAPERIALSFEEAVMACMQSPRPRQ